MNNGLMGFPSGGANGDITGKKAWWKYVDGSAAVAGMPTRTTGVWYYNNSGDELKLSIVASTGAGPGGVNVICSKFPQAAPVALANILAADTNSDKQTYVIAGGSYGQGSGDNPVTQADIPAGHWYYIRPYAVEALTLKIWNEYRRNP